MKFEQARCGRNHRKIEDIEIDIIEDINIDIMENVNVDFMENMIMNGDFPNMNE